jgi:pyrroloquinoline quinone biosynthesis protein D
MTERPIIVQVSVPHLAPHMRLRFDNAREVWTIQAPERTFMLDEVSHAIVSRCDGEASVETIIEGLCATFQDAPRNVIERDVIALLQNFADKGVIRV